MLILIMFINCQPSNFLVLIMRKARIGCRIVFKFSLLFLNFSPFFLDNGSGGTLMRPNWMTLSGFFTFYFLDLFFCFVLVFLFAFFFLSFCHVLQRYNPILWGFLQEVLQVTQMVHVIQAIFRGLFRYGLLKLFVALAFQLLKSYLAYLLLLLPLFEYCSLQKVFIVWLSVKRRAWLSVLIGFTFIVVG